MYPALVTILEGKIMATTPFKRLVKPIPEVPIPGNDHRRISADLSWNAYRSRSLSPVHLRRVQLPDHIPHSALRKPESWVSRSTFLAAELLSSPVG